MTMVVVGLLHGKTKEQWYNQIAARVANGDGPCAPPEYAELRGPGARQRFDDSPDEYELEFDNRRNFNVRSNRIILLGDGTEVLSEGDEDLFDRGDEAEDVANQVRKRSADEPSDEQAREEREGTPGPQLTRQRTPQTTDISFLGSGDSTSPPSTTK
jgi:protein phosphatase 2C family protein 2/3